MKIKDMELKAVFVFGFIMILALLFFMYFRNPNVVSLSSQNWSCTQWKNETFDNFLKEDWNLTEAQYKQGWNNIINIDNTSKSLITSYCTQEGLNCRNEVTNLKTINVNVNGWNYTFPEYILPFFTIVELNSSHQQGFVGYFNNNFTFECLQGTISIDYTQNIYGKNFTTLSCLGIKTVCDQYRDVG